MAVPLLRPVGSLCGSWCDMVELQEPRPEANAYYPDRVAISHTTSEAMAGTESWQFSWTVTGDQDLFGVDVPGVLETVFLSRWELGFQGAFLDPDPDPDQPLELELDEWGDGWSRSKEGVQLELPCPVVAINGVCEVGHHWAKACICNREWCMELEGRCGGDGGAAHERRKARWYPKAQKMGGMGGFVLSLPPEVRDQYRTPESLGGLGTSAKRMMQRHGYKRGLRRWHFFGEDHPGHGLQGDGLPNYHPHLEMIVDGGWLTNKKRRAIKCSWANILGVSVDRINLYYRYVQPDDIKKKLHRISYALRPTFTDWRWDEELAYNLIGFHNAQTWGSKADWSGPNLWEITDGTGNVVDYTVQLVKGLCPLHPEWECWPIRWGGLIPIQLVVEPFWKSLGAGYWRWIGLGEPVLRTRARDGPELVDDS